MWLTCQRRLGQLPEPIFTAVVLLYITTLNDLPVELSLVFEFVHDGMNVTVEAA